MADSAIVCPNLSCQQTLRVPSEALGRSASCPHCKSGIRIEVDPTTQQFSAVLQPVRGWKVPYRMMVPGFSLLILGFAAAFVNFYVAGRCMNDPGFDIQYARDRVGDFQNGSELTAFGKKKSDPDAYELLAAVAGNGMAMMKRTEDEETIAQAWSPYIRDVHFTFAGISLVSAIGGFCILRGRFYWLAIIGCLASMININNGCCIPGSVAGIWGLLMLFRDDGRRHFRILP